MPPKPSLELLRSITDESVLRLLMEEGRMTRAEIAARSGISKTTISESMRRLSEARIVADTGERTTGRGRSGLYYSLAKGTGCALVASISPEGVIAEALDAVGRVVAQADMPLAQAPGKARTSQALRDTVSRVRDASPGPIQLSVISAADPVDRTSNKLVQLPDAPFLVGELDPAGTLASLVAGDVLVDNDVNWAARAERRCGSAGDVDDLVYLHLGQGLGCAVVSDGEVRRGHRGLAGEIAHVMTRGPSGAAVPFTQVFEELGLRKPGSTAIDVDALEGDLRQGPSFAVDVAAVLADAVSGVLLAATAFSDPELIVLGGTWARQPTFFAALAERAAAWPRGVPIRASTVLDRPEMVGARWAAVQLLRSAIVETSR
jgi:predicted NBD/HSP70 family sugar kinase